MHPAAHCALDLQPLQNGAATILRLLAASSPNWPEVALVAARDPALCLALLAAEPLAADELEKGLNSALRRRLERVGADLLRAWLLGLGNAAGPRSGPAGEALLQAECALHLALETGYPRPDEAYLGGLWRQLAEDPTGATGDDAWAERATRALRPDNRRQHFAALIRSCGLPASLSDALELGNLLDEQWASAHPLLRLLRCAELLAAEGWQQRCSQAAALCGLPESTLLSLRTDVGYIVSGHAAYPPPARTSETMAGLPATVADDPYRSAGMLGLLTSAFVELDADQVGDRLAIACTLFGLREVPVLLGADETGLLRALLPGGPASPTAMIDELRLREDDEASCIALCARAEQPTSFFPAGASPGRSLADWHVARWLGHRGFCCLPLTGAGHTAVALIASSKEHPLSTEQQWRYAALLGAAVRSIRAANRQRDEIAAREAALHQRFREHVRKIAHEASNPLTVIKSRLGMLGQQRPGDDALQDEMVQLNTELDRIDNLLRAAGELPAETAEAPRCKVPELLLDMRAIYGEPLFASRDIQLELRAAKGAPAAAIPASALKQVLLNLFRNASEALQPGHRLVVSVAGQLIVDGRHCLEIRLVDNGPGLPPDRAADLFSPRRSTKGGTHQGVGLAVVREILTRWGASILCRSQPGSGTSFQIFIPLDQKG